MSDTRTYFEEFPVPDNSLCARNAKASVLMLLLQLELPDSLFTNTFKLYPTLAFEHAANNKNDSKHIEKF